MEKIDILKYYWGCEVVTTLYTAGGKLTGRNTIESSIKAVHIISNGTALSLVPMETWGQGDGGTCVYVMMLSTF